MNNRIFLIVIDSMGIGDAPDAEKFGDSGANTLLTLYNSGKLFVPNMEKMGLFSIDNNNYKETKTPENSYYARLIELSNAKDTTTGHWEMMNVISQTGFPTFYDGFPEDFLKEFSKKINRPVLCNQVYSGTEVIKDYGKESIEKGAVIVYTSADSVFQIAAHEDYISKEELYNICHIARKMLVGELGVGRVIARPFDGEYPFNRVNNDRHDYTITPPRTTLNELQDNNIKTIGIGKIYDIFNGSGIAETIPNRGNAENLKETTKLILDKNFEKGLCFVNLVDTDAIYGHRRNIDGYVNAVNEIDKWVGNDCIPHLGKNDYLVITADHGCDPAYKGTDHTRECVPLLIYNKEFDAKNLGTIRGFNYISDFIKEKLL